MKDGLPSSSVSLTSDQGGWGGANWFVLQTLTDN